MVKRIKDLCEGKKISLRQLEIELGFSNGALAKWDVSSPSADKVRKVAAFFGVTCDYIINGQEDGGTGAAARDYGN